MKIFTSYSKILLFSLLAFLVSWKTQAQDIAIKGTVKSKEGQLVPNVRVSIENSEFVVTDKSGKFTIYSSKKISDKPDSEDIRIEKCGFEYAGHSPKEGGIEIIVKAKSFNVDVRVLDDARKPFDGAKVEFKDPFVQTYTSNQDGAFRMTLQPYTEVNTAIKVYVDGVLVPSRDIRYEEQSCSLTIISKRVYWEKIGVFTTENVELGGGVKVTVNNQTYETNGIGKVVLPSHLKDTNARITIEGYTIAEVNYLKDRTISIFVKKQTSTSDPVNDPNIDPITTDPSTNTSDNTAISDAELEENFSYLITEIEDEKRILLEKTEQIRREIERTLQRLSIDKEMPEDQKVKLRQYLDRLERALQENEDAYQKAQEKTNNLLKRLKNDLMHKDSLIAQEKRNQEMLEAERAQQRRNTFIVFLVSAAIVVSLSVLVFVFSRMARRMRKQKNELETVNSELKHTRDDLILKVEELNQKKEEISVQAENLLELNKEISNKNTKILDSIRYAQTIQEAILPTEKDFEAAFAEHFVMYRPKDMVSGDLYWLNQVHFADGSTRTFLAAVDCTGHGVPGAFMSMIGNALLSEIVNHEKIYDPAKILMMLNYGIIESLKQENKINDDGMDVALCSIEQLPSGDLRVLFSGAKRPMYYIQKDTSAVQVIRGVNKSIGGKQNPTKNYLSNEIILSKGDAIFFFSDGLTDQNNLANVKFSAQKLTEFLEANAHRNIKEMGTMLVEEFDAHTLGTEQRDDIMFVGVRL